MIECTNCHGEGMLWTMTWTGAEYGDRCRECDGRGALLDDGRFLPRFDDEGRIIQE